LAAIAGRYGLTVPGMLLRMAALEANRHRPLQPLPEADLSNVIALFARARAAKESGG
jgi:hypothetical protein